jgi:hypothetical protein
MGIISSVSVAQCLPYEPSHLDSLDSGQMSVALAAASILRCCAQCTNSDDMHEVVDDILEKLEEGDIYAEEGNNTWRAYTSPDVMCGGGDGAYTLDPGNAIVLNAALFFDYSDPVATAAVLAGALAHEQLRALTLNTGASFTTSPPTYSDPCHFYANEVLCHEAELFVLNCIVACSCLDGLTGGGATDLTGRAADVAASRDYYANLHSENC